MIPFYIAAGSMYVKYTGCKLSRSKRAAPLPRGKMLMEISESKSEPDGHKGVISGFS